MGPWTTPQQAADLLNMAALLEGAGFPVDPDEDEERLYVPMRHQEVNIVVDRFDDIGWSVWCRDAEGDEWGGPDGLDRQAASGVDAPTPSTALSLVQEFTRRYDQPNAFTKDEAERLAGEATGTLERPPGYTLA